MKRVLAARISEPVTGQRIAFVLSVVFMVWAWFVFMTALLILLHSDLRAPQEGRTFSGAERAIIYGVLLFSVCLIPLQLIRYWRGWQTSTAARLSPRSAETGGLQRGQ